jgi:hypothetical protein
MHCIIVAGYPGFGTREQPFAVAQVMLRRNLLAAVARHLEWRRDSLQWGSDDGSDASA